MQLVVLISKSTQMHSSARMRCTLDLNGVYKPPMPETRNFSTDTTFCHCCIEPDRVIAFGKSRDFGSSPAKMQTLATAISITTHEPELRRISNSVCCQSLTFLAPAKRARALYLLKKCWQAHRLSLRVEGKATRTIEVIFGHLQPLHRPNQIYKRIV